MKGFSVNVSYDNFRRLKEGAFSLLFTTAKICDKEDILTFNEVVGQTGKILFETDTGSEVDILEVKTDDLTNKTPSERLRSVLWVLQRQELKREPTNEEFRVFYNDWMDRMILGIKAKLDN